MCIVYMTSNNQDNFENYDMKIHAVKPPYQACLSNGIYIHHYHVRQQVLCLFAGQVMEKAI